MYETWVFIHNGGEAIKNDRNFIPVLKDLEEMAKKHGVEITLFVEGSERMFCEIFTIIADIMLIIVLLNTRFDED